MGTEKVIHLASEVFNSKDNIIPWLKKKFKDPRIPDTFKVGKYYDCGSVGFEVKNLKTVD